MKKLLLAAIVFCSVSAHADKFDGVMFGGFDIYSVRQAPPVAEWVVPGYSDAERIEILKNYDHLDQRNLIDTRALENAVLFFHANKAKIPNQKFITVIDFHKHSGQRRLFVVNMTSGSVEALHTAHGQGSDKNNDGYADTFSNIPDSRMSSLGFYLTAETYNGSNGYSLKLDGLSVTNSLARDRYIVIHGADYVTSSRSQMGLSWGCPALEWSVYTRIINTLKNGSLLYAWKP